MSVVKLISTSLLAIGVSSFCLYAAAANDLILTNNTNEDSTVMVKGGACSKWLPGGITKAHSSNKVTHDTLEMACWGQEQDCKADVYMTADCTGDIVASAEFSVDSGLLGKPTKRSDKYIVDGTGFNLSMNYTQ